MNNNENNNNDDSYLILLAKEEVQKASLSNILKAEQKEQHVEEQKQQQLEKQKRLREEKRLVEEKQKLEEKQLKLKLDDNRRATIDLVNDVAKLNPNSTQQQLLRLLSREHGINICERTLRNYLNGHFTLNTTAKGGRPPSLPKHLYRELGNSVADAAKNKNGGLTLRDIKGVVTKVWEKEQQIAGKDASNPPKFSRIIETISTESGRNLRGLQEKFRDQLHVNAATPQNAYVNLMSLRQAMKLVKSSGSPVDTCESNRIFAMDECGILDMSIEERGGRFVYVEDRSDLDVKIKRNAVHITSAVFYDMTEFLCLQLVLNCNIGWNENAAFLGLGTEDVIINKTGSMTGGDALTGEKGSFYVAVKKFVDHVNARLGIPENRGWVLLILDGAKIHLCLQSLQYLKDNYVHVHLLLPNTTPFAQISDQPQLHGFQKKHIREVLAQAQLYNQDVGLSRDIKVLTSTIRDVFTSTRIRQAVQNVGIQFVAGSAFSRIQLTEADARAHVQKLADKGWFNHLLQDLLRESSLRRTEEVKILNNLIKTGAVPSGTLNIVNAESLRVMREGIKQTISKNVEFVEGANKRRKRNVQDGLTVVTDLKVDHRIVNDATILAQRDAQVKADLETKEKSQARKKKQVENQKKKDMIESRKKVLVEKMLSNGISVSTTELRCVSKYYLGKGENFTLEWAINKLTAKLAKPATTAKNTKTNPPISTAAVANENITPGTTTTSNKNNNSVAIATTKKRPTRPSCLELPPVENEPTRSRSGRPQKKSRLILGTEYQ
jgi:hypothetical protein